MLGLQIPVVRYEHAAPGDMLHIDIKKFARIIKAGHRITATRRMRPAEPVGSALFKQARYYFLDRPYGMPFK